MGVVNRLKEVNNKALVDNKPKVVNNKALVDNKPKVVNNNQLVDNNKQLVDNNKRKEDNKPLEDNNKPPHKMVPKLWLVTTSSPEILEEDPLMPNTRESHQLDSQLTQMTFS